MLESCLDINGVHNGVLLMTVRFSDVDQKLSFDAWLKKDSSEVNRDKPPKPPKPPSLLTLPHDGSGWRTTEETFN